MSSDTEARAVAKARKQAIGYKAVQEAAKFLSDAERLLAESLSGEPPDFSDEALDIAVLIYHDEGDDWRPSAEQRDRMRRALEGALSVP